MEAPLIEARRLQKWYSGVHALNDVDFKVSKGEVVGLVGDNGAGKTTLIKILSGVHPPDGGEIRIEGRKVDITSPRQAMSLGIETIYQTNSMVPTMSIARNLFIGREPLRASILGFGFMDQGRMRRDSVKAIADVDLHLLGQHARGFRVVRDPLSSPRTTPPLSPVVILPSCSRSSGASLVISGRCTP